MDPLKSFNFSGRPGEAWFQRRVLHTRKQADHPLLAVFILLIVQGSMHEKVLSAKTAVLHHQNQNLSNFEMSKLDILHFNIQS